MKVTVRKKSIPTVLCFVILLFNNPIYLNSTNTFISSGIQYFDEVLVILMALHLICKMCRKKRFSLGNKIAIALVCFFLIGIIGNIRFKIQPLFLVLVDILICSKFAIAFFWIKNYMEDGKRDDSILRTLNPICRVIITGLFTLLIINVFVYRIYPTGEYRYFMYSETLFFFHTYQLGITCFVCSVILLYNCKYKKNQIFLVLTTILMFFTLRTKLFADMFVLWGIYYYFIHLRKKNTKIVLLAGIVGVLLIGGNQIANYYTNQEQARAALTMAGASIAMEHFPTGVGFATFGSDVSAKYYSPVYYEYGLDKVFGCGGTNISFISDAFWPAVLGQNGWIGLLIFFGIIYCFYKECFKIKAHDIYAFSAALLILIHESIETFGGSAFYNPMATLLFILFGMLVSKKCVSNEKGEKSAKIRCKNGEIYEN